MAETLKTDSFEMRYSKFGEGEKIFVIIPGISLKSVLNSEGAVIRQYKKIAANHTCYLFDRITKFPQEYSVKQMAEDTALAMQKLNIKNAVIFGTSQGGMIAQSIAINHPELVSKLILASTASKINEKAKNIFDSWVLYAKTKPVQELISLFVSDVYSEEFCETYKNALISILSDATEEEISRFTIMSDACLGLSTYDELEKIKCPAFVLGSRQDKLFDMQTQTELAQKLGAQTFFYDNLSHGFYDEDRHFVEKILDFVNA